MKAILLLIPFFSCTAFAEEITPKELKLDKIIRIHGKYEPSGVAIRDSSFLFVSDDLIDRQLYQLDLDTGKVTNDLDLQVGLRVIDLEGLAYCKNIQTYFVANERAREIWRIKDQKEIFTIDDADVQKGGANAGLEGVAVDCENQIGYAAKERQPRMIYAFDLKQAQDGKAMKPIEKFDLPFTSDKTPDFADLFFMDGKLFVLERNIQQVTVWDTKQKAITAKYSYAHVRDHEFDDNKDGKIQKSERGLFDTKEPFGLAEGLIIDGSYMYVLLDNNDSKLSTWAAKKYKLEKTSEPLVMRFLIQ